MTISSSIPIKQTNQDATKNSVFLSLIYLNYQSRKISKKEQKRYAEKYLNEKFEVDSTDLLAESIAETMGSQAISLGDRSVHEDKSTEDAE